MRRRSLLAVLAIGSAVMLAQVNARYPKTPGEVTVAGKPKPIVVFCPALRVLASVCPKSG